MYSLGRHDEILRLSTFLGIGDWFPVCICIQGYVFPPSCHKARVAYQITTLVTDAFHIHFYRNLPRPCQVGVW